MEVLTTVAYSRKITNTRFMDASKPSGGRIDIWYPADGCLTEASWGIPMISVRDSKYLSGQVGIWHESWSNGVIDNLTITDAKEHLPLIAKGNALATEWGAIKASK